MHHTICVGREAIQAMLGRNNREPEVRAQVVHRPENIFGGLRVELRRRLIEEDDARVHRENRSDGDPLQLAAGERAHGAVPEVDDTERIEHLFEPPADQARVGAEVLEAEDDLVLDRRRYHLCFGLLKDEAGDRGQFARLTGARVDAGYSHAAFKRAAVKVRNESIEAAQEGRLAPAGRPREQEHLSLVDSEIEVPDHGRRLVGVCECEPADLDDRFAHGPFSAGESAGMRRDKHAIAGSG